MKSLYCNDVVLQCYELKDLATGEITAGKIVPKSLLTKNHQKEKMSQEIRWAIKSNKEVSSIYVFSFAGCTKPLPTPTW